MYDEQTFNNIMKRCLDRVPSTIDKREGSIIYDALAPAVIEIAELYIVLGMIVKESFATTSSRPNLIKRASEFNIYPYPSTKATAKGVFNMDIPIGSRFNYEKLNFVVVKKIEGDHTYELQCETSGIDGNDCIGNITPVENIEGLTMAKIVGLISPASDEEETEHFRERFFETIKSKAYGGNGADYKQKVNAINGVGGCKIYRGLNGGGTVGVTIITNQFKGTDTQLVNEVQTILDPIPNQGQGYGVAPIGHTVTVKSVTEKAINVAMSISTTTSTNFGALKSQITKAIDEYLGSLRESWSKQTEKEKITVRTAHIISKILAVQGVVDVTNVRINGSADRVELGTDDIPIVGEVTNS